MKCFKKFEYVYAFVILLILAIALFIFRSDKDLVNIIITTLVGASSAITTFFFTKHMPGGENKDE